MTVVDAATAGGAAASSRETQRNSSALSRLEASLAVPAAHLSVGELRHQMRLVRQVQAIASARLIELHDAMVGLSITPGSPCAVDPVSEVRTHGGLRARDIRSLDTQTSAVAAAPALGDLLAAGATTAAHVEAVGRALVCAGDGRDALLGRVDHIVERAITMNVDDFDRHMRRLARDAQPDQGLSRFEQQRRSTHLRIWNDRDGMTRLAGAFDPERGAALIALLDRHVEAMFHTGDRDIPVEVAPGIDPNDHRRALALHHVCTQRTSDPEPGEPVTPMPARAEVIVHIDHDTLVHGLHEHSVCRTSGGADLPPDTVRRLACDADIIPIVLTGGSVPIDVGRSRRLATVHQRRALEAIHTTCAIIDCHVAFSHCTIHHLEPWEKGGTTDLHNLVPLCSRHHHAAHEGGWSLTLDRATRHLTVRLPGDHPGNDP